MVRLETTGIVFQGIVGFDGVGLVLANDVGRVFVDETLEFLAGRVGVRV